MTIKEFVNTWNGHGIDVDGAYGDQCWDLAAKYVKEIIGCPSLPTRPGGNGYAKDCFEHFLSPLPQYFKRIYNDPSKPNQVPLPGDVIVWGENGYGGHIAIVLEAKPGEPTVKVFQQNSPIGQPATIGHLSYSGCLGWLAPRTRPVYDKPNAAPKPVVKSPMPSGEFYNVKSGDTFWALEQRWGLATGTLQSLNAATNARELRIGQAIRIRQKPAKKPAPASAEFRKLVKGDTFWDLENTLGLPHGRLQELNPSLNPRALKVGTMIRIKPAPKPVVKPKPKAAALAAVQDEPAATKPLSASIDEAKPVATEPIPDPVPQPDPAATAPAAVAFPNTVASDPSFLQKHFNKDKIIKDLAAFGTLVGAAVAWIADNHALVGFMLSLLSGIIFGENRFKRK
jgi:LysM repeat protein